MNPDDLLKLLPMLAPVILELLKRLTPMILDRMPWYLKAVASAVIGAIIAMLTEMVPGLEGDVLSGGAIGAAAALGYRIKGNKAK